MNRCIWCDSELPPEEAAAKEVLCFNCNRSELGLPGPAVERLDYLPFGVIEINREGVILAFNKAEEDSSGLARSEVIGRNFFTDVAPCANVQSFRGRFGEFLNGPQLSERFEYVYYLPGGVEDVRVTFLRINREVALVLSKRSKRASA